MITRFRSAVSTPPRCGSPPSELPVGHRRRWRTTARRGQAQGVARRQRCHIAEQVRGAALRPAPHRHLRTGPALPTGCARCGRLLVAVGRGDRRVEPVCPGQDLRAGERQDDGERLGTHIGGSGRADGYARTGCRPSERQRAGRRWGRACSPCRNSVSETGSERLAGNHCPSPCSARRSSSTLAGGVATITSCSVTVRPSGERTAHHFGPAE